MGGTSGYLSVLRDLPWLQETSKQARMKQGLLVSSGSVCAHTTELVSSWFGKRFDGRDWLYLQTCNGRSSLATRLGMKPEGY